jgi:hypothetical protein
MELMGTTLRMEKADKIVVFGAGVLDVYHPLETSVVVLALDARASQEHPHRKLT